MVTATTGPGFEMDSATEEALDFKALPKIEVCTPYGADTEALELGGPAALMLMRCFPPSSLQLHAHLSGSISRQCLHEVWRQRGETGLEDPLAAMPDGKHDYDLKT